MPYTMLLPQSLHGPTEATPILDGLIHKPHSELEERVFIHRLGEYICHHIICRNELDSYQQTDIAGRSAGPGTAAIPRASEARVSREEREEQEVKTP